METLTDLYTRHAALSLEKQLALGQIIGTCNFSFDAEAGTLSFGHGLQFAMQLLGTVSRQSSTWLWAWASPKPTHAALLQAAHQLRILGERTEIAELAQEGFDLITPALTARALLADKDADDNQPEPLDGHYIALIATGVCQAAAYYGADYGRGIAYVLLPQVPAVQLLLSDKPSHLAAVFTQLLQLPYVLDHRAALVAYLQQKGYTTEVNGPQVRGIKAGNELVAAFDGTGHLSALTVSDQAVA